MSTPDVPTFTSSPLIVNSTTVTVEFSLGSNGGSNLTDIQYARDTDGYTTWTSLGLSAPLEGYSNATVSGLTAPSSGSYKIRSVNAIGPSSESDAAVAYQYTLNSGEYYPKVVFSSNNQYALAIKYNNSASDEAAVSSDGGVTWTPITPPTGDDCYDVAMSANGGYMYYETYPGGGVYQSTDHGATFTQLMNAPLSVSCMACDSTGQKVYCPSDDDGYMYVSNDYGANFTQTHNFGFYVTWMACSANGQYVHAYNGADVYVSNDYGVTFTLTTTITQSVNISYIACDQTGQKVFLATNDGILCSLNYGTSFIQTSHPNNICYSVSCDSLGNRVIAVASDGTTRVSYNAGTTWEVQTIIGQGLTTGFFGVSISPDGTRYVSSIGAPGTYIITRGTADVAPIWFAKTDAVYYNGTISTNNQYMVATSYHPSIGNAVVAYSSDAGATWNETSDFGYVYYALASASGQTVLALVNDLPYLSTDYGATFSITSLSLLGPDYPYYAVISSSGTSMMTTSGSDGYIYVSTDSGVTWTSPYQFIDGFIYLACASATLDRIYVILYPNIGGLSTTYVSTNMGSSWTPVSISPSASDSNYMACDWSGQKLVLSTYDDGVYRSIDGGVSWTQTAAPTGSVNMSYISSNSTGNRIVVTDDNNNISYVSLDAGATWTILCTPGTNANSGYQSGVMISPDGSRSMIAHDPLGTYFQTLGAADFPVVPCFLEGSKILCQIDGVEKYVAVETIRPGTLVKTCLHGFQPVKLIGSRVMVNMGGDNRDKNSLYLCTKENYPEITEDLTITGCHAILVNQITDAHRNGIIKTLERVFVTDKKYRLPACVDERAAVVQKAGTFTVWHFALEHADIKMNYGVYAQGLLVESSPIWHMNTKNYQLVQ